MDRRTAAKIGGLTAWHNDPAGKQADSLKGGQATLKRYGKAHYVRMSAKATDARRKRDARCG